MSKDRNLSPGESRRSFLKKTLVSSVAATVLPSVAFADKDSNMLFSKADIKPGEFDEITINELAKGIRSGKYTARSITEKYIKRIKEIDKSGPSINSIIELNPDALKIADILDVEFQEKGPRSLMHGIPVLIKDNIDTADRMQTTAGSIALLGSKPQKDSFIVNQLREAGAIILGKTNLSEWANFRSNFSTSGWSARGGLTKNPYALDRSTSGSSSGSGAGVSANLCAVAVGTETDGSVVSPSSINGIVGIKPTIGLLSRAGIIPISHSQDTAGPMARTVKDAAILLGAMTGVDQEDEVTKKSQGNSYTDYVKFLDPDALKGARIGVFRQYFGFLPQVDEIMEDAMAVLKKKGATLITPVKVDKLVELGDAELTVLLYEIKSDMKDYLEHRGPDTKMNSLTDLIEFNRNNEDKEMLYFRQELFLAAEKKGPLTDNEYLNALDIIDRIAREDGIDAIMDKYKLDALISPTDSPAWVTDLINGDHYLGGSSSLAAIAGYPHITVPAGFVFGLPVGISFFGRAWSEPVLLKLAYAFEQATKIRRPPQFLSTADLKG